MKQMETRPWVRKARAAIAQLSGETELHRERALQKLAVPRSAQTLRRDIAALEFLNKLTEEKVFLGTKLEVFPVAAIEHIMRWYARDPGAALKAADDLLGGVYTAKTLGNAERDSRTKVFEGVGKALDANYRRKIEKEIELIASNLGKVTRMKEKDLRSLSYPITRAIDFGFLDDNGHFFASFVIAGPYNDKDLYARRSFDWISKANTLLNIFKFVYLIIPENADESTFLRLQQQLIIDSARLRIMTVALINRDASYSPRPK